MPCCEWSKLSSLQLGRYAEYYAMMELASYGFEIYRTEVDENGIDFIARKPKSDSLSTAPKAAKDFPDEAWVPVQVKSVRNEEVTADSRVFRWKYTFIKANKIELDNYHWVMYLQFLDGYLPRVFFFPALSWSNDSIEHNALTTQPSKKTNPSAQVQEYGISFSNVNKESMEPFLLNQSIPDEVDSNPGCDVVPSVGSESYGAVDPSKQSLNTPIPLPWDDKTILQKIKESLS